MSPSQDEQTKCQVQAIEDRSTPTYSALVIQYIAVLLSGVRFFVLPESPKTTMVRS